MSADNVILISRKQLKAWHKQSDFTIRKNDKPIATGKNLDELIDNVEKWRKEMSDEYGYFEIEYGISFLD